VTPFNVIHSCDDGHFFDFAPLVRHAWGRFFPEATVIIGVVGRDCVAIDGIPIPNQAKMLRNWVASMTPGINMISDMDLIPLQRGWLEGKLNEYCQGCLMGIGREVLFNTVDRGKWPSGYTTADRDTWRDFLNPSIASWPGWLNTMRGLYVAGDGMEDPCAPPPMYSDESMLRARWLRWSGNKDRSQWLPREWEPVKDSLDRMDWTFDVKKLNAGQYIEAHMPRPYAQHLDDLAPVFDYLEFIL
jgi:hypothetical protein